MAALPIEIDGKRVTDAEFRSKMPISILSKYERSETALPAVVIEMPRS